MTTRKLQDEEAFLDAAIQQALGTGRPEEADAFAVTLAQSDAEAQRTARELRETVAKLAAASPYMEPPEKLRGAILEATVPQTFKMEDYRRKADAAPRMLRWALVAAVVFLVASAWYTTGLQNKVKEQGQQIARLQQGLQGQNAALMTVMDPTNKRVNLVRDGEVVATAFVNDHNKTSVLMIPANMIPANTTPLFSMPDEQGKPQPYRTITVAIDGGKRGPAIDPNVQIGAMKPVAQPQVYEAGMGGK